MIWKKITIVGRKDIVGVRTLPSGQRQFRIFNKNLCQQYYTALEAM